MNTLDQTCTGIFLQLLEKGKNKSPIRLTENEYLQVEMVTGVLTALGGGFRHKISQLSKINTEWQIQKEMSFVILINYNNYYDPNIYPYTYWDATSTAIEESIVFDEKGMNAISVRKPLQHKNYAEEWLTAIAVRLFDQ